MQFLVNYTLHEPTFNEIQKTSYLSHSVELFPQLRDNFP